MPKARPLSFTALLSGRHDCDYVEISGVAQRAWSVELAAHAVPGRRGGGWHASGPRSGTTPRRTSSASSTRGCACAATSGTLFTEAGQLRGVSLFVGRVSDVVVEDAAARPDPSCAPARSRASTSTRRAARSTVASGSAASSPATCPGRPVELTDFSTETTLPARPTTSSTSGTQTSGARIETDAGGVAAAGRRRRRRRLSGGDAHQAHAAQRDPAQGGHRQPSPPRWRSARERARAWSTTRSWCGSTGQLLGVVEGPERARARGPDRRGRRRGERRRHAGRPRASRAIRPGSVVAVTGVYVYQWGPPPSFRILLRSAHDVALVTAAPWWTLRHSLVVAGILALVPGARRASGRAVGHEPQRPARAAVPGDPGRAQPPGARAARHARAGAGGRQAPARGRGREPRRALRTPPAARSTSRARCCATAWTRRAAR